MILENLGYYQSKAGTVLYKYSSVDSAELILRFHQLKITCPSDLNDSFEFRADNFDFTVSSVDHLASLTKSQSLMERNLAFSYLQNSKNFPVIFQDFLVNYKDNFKVCCFSEKYDHKLMWTHYGDNNKGICFGFKFPDRYYENFFKVKYVDTPEKIKIWELQKYFFIPWACTKNVDYVHEHEVRYQEITDKKYLVFHKDWFNEIHFGRNVSNENMGKIMAYLCVLGYDHVKAYKMVEEGAYSYKLVREAM